MKISLEKFDALEMLFAENVLAVAGLHVANKIASARKLDCNLDSAIGNAYTAAYVALATREPAEKSAQFAAQKTLRAEIRKLELDDVAIERVVIAILTTANDAFHRG